MTIVPSKAVYEIVYEMSLRNNEAVWYPARDCCPPQFVIPILYLLNKESSYPDRKEGLHWRVLTKRLFSELDDRKGTSKKPQAKDNRKLLYT